MRFNIGIDPGKSGALGIITEDWIIAYPFDETKYCETLRYIHDLIQSKSNSAFVVVEHVHSMPKQGVSSSFNFGRNFGWILGTLDALSIPYELVNPQKWKREFSCTSDKNTSVDCARRLFHGVNMKRTERCAKDDDGMAEALLMAEYARRNF